MPRLAMRAAAVLIALLTGSCAALFPRHVTTAERLAVFPTSGLPLDKPVTIRWNEYQVPYIEAQTDHDLAFALGLVHAHLRLAEIIIAKHIADGRLSELGGPFTLPGFDQAIRTLNLHYADKAIIAAMPEQTRAYLQAFVDGVNYYQSHVEDLPPEFTFLNMQREDLTIEDVVAFGHIAGIDISWFTMINLMRQRSDPNYDQIYARTIEAGRGPTISFDATKTSQFFDLLSGAIRSGSDSFAVGPSRSASGSAMIASDPHLSVALPNLWVMAGYSSPSYRGVGMMIPGTPFLAFGRTPDIAWGGTNMHAAQTDFYDVSKLQPGEITESETEIKKRLWFSSDVKLRRSQHFGPILSDTVLMDGATKPGEVVAARWIGHEVSDEITAILNASRAKTPQDFRAALKTFALPAQNFIYADTSGNIAQLAAAMIPIRSFDVPPKSIVLDASDPQMTWKGILDPTQLPWSVNPPDGFVASANNRPYDAPHGQQVGFFFSADERIRRIQQMLSAKPKITVDDLKAMQRDTVSLFVREMMPALDRDIAAVPGARDIDPAYVDRLTSFDGDYRADSTGAPAFETFLYYLAPHVYGVAKAEDIPSYLSNWNGLGRAFIADLDAMAPDARATAIKDAITHGAEDAKAFATWGDMHRLQVQHVLAVIPWIGNAFVYENLPTGGSRETVFKTAHGFENGLHNARYGSQARHVSDLGDLDSNWMVLLGGNDGWIGSDNFLDQVALWQKGDYIRMPLRPQTIAAEFKAVMTLSP